MYHDIVGQGHTTRLKFKMEINKNCVLFKSATPSRGVIGFSSFSFFIIILNIKSARSN